MRMREKSGLAVFDIKPVDQTGKVDLVKIEGLKPEIDLRSGRTRFDLLGDSKSNLGETEQGPTFLEIQGRTLEAGTEIQGRTLGSVPEELVPHLVFGPFFPEPKTKEQLTRELEEELKKEQQIETVLANVGGEVFLPRFDLPADRHGFFGDQGRTLKRKNISFPRVENRPVVEPIFSPAAREMDVLLANFNNNERLLPAELPSKKEHLPNLFGAKFKVICLCLVITTLASFGLFKLKNNLQTEVVQNGNEAVKNLETAKEDIEKFDFASAASRFALAYENFSSASSNLNLLGSSLSSFLGDLPGLGKLKSAQNLSKAGENIAEAGKTLSLAADNFYRSNLALKKKSFLDYITPLKTSLVSAQERVKLASQLFAGIDEDIISEEKKEAFLDFKSKLPDLENFVDEALNYAGFLSEIVGESGPKKYLVLFQNNTELRPTGGFIGSYALADFSRGFLRELKVEDVYYTDGQAKKNIIPPKELQHITPNWGMRDANWFVNFPDSARKIMEMYTENDGGPLVDGVVALTPTVISKILEVTGPIELAEYGRTIGSENFLAEIQEEVEYGENREKPKQILIDFMPKFMEALGKQDKEKWLEVFKILALGVEQKHILAYFKNSSLEKAAVGNGFGGEVKKTDGDFLMVVHSNVKGSKTDAVIDNIYELDSWISEDGFVEHELRVKRKHNGGKTKLGFYNRINYDFVRILAPDGSVLSEIKGDYRAKFKPLIDYGEVGGFVSDADLENYEESEKESGKTVFGFWIKTEPGETQEVILNYKTPVSVSDGEYTLLVQKQPGTIDDGFNFSFEPPEGKTVTYKYPELDVQDDVVYLDTYLLKDLVIGLKLQ